MFFRTEEEFLWRKIYDESVKYHTAIDLIDKSQIERTGDIVSVLNDTLNIIPHTLISIDTQNYSLYESTDENSLSRYNFGEIKIVKYLIGYLTLNLKLSPDSIGVITPYSAQVNGLKV